LTFYERLTKGGWAREGVTAEEERAEIEREAGMRDAKRQTEIDAGQLPDPSLPPVPPNPPAFPPAPKAA